MHQDLAIHEILAATPQKRKWKFSCNNPRRTREVDSFQVASAVTLDQRLLVRTSIRNHKAVSLELDGQKNIVRISLAHSERSKRMGQRKS
mmetsp:Transcript_10476/g.64093  ORF Transcript_10476/g.64093 Transcript_10476/m.64093 type:complete len:90 (+) Transcript_10476:2118-2387(+)